MTDNEIIKALECCISDGYTCKECPYADTKHMIGDEYELMPNGRTYDEFSCDEWLKLDLFDLINRQKAEIERLQKHIKEGIVLARQLPELASAIRAEAIKEFAERLKALPECQDVPAVLAVIDDLVKEMVGDSDEN